ncbi:MAG: beta galactosidase jelly roll domain-containing protein [Leptospira sp.]|nr:beta galactosidase jelly roll domain-containing protein [Leptospira sp.]
MLHKVKSFIIIFLFFLGFPLFSKDSVADSYDLSPEDPIIWLTGLWNFYDNDDREISRADYKDSNPYILNVENEWRLQGVDYEGIGWFRNYFTLSNYDFPLDLGLIVPPISGASEVYVNGVKIGSAGSYNEEGEITHYSTPFRFYKVSKEILNLEKPNSISIRIIGYQGIAGLYGNNFLFLGEFEKSWSRYILLILVVTIFSSAFVVIGLYHFILYFGQHKNREFLYFGLLGMVIGFHLICMNGLGYYLVDHFYFNQIGIHLAVGFIPLCYVGFISHFFERKHPVLERIGWGFAIIVILHLILLPIIPKIFRTCPKTYLY